MRARGPAVALALLAVALSTATSGCFRRQFPERRQFILSADRTAPVRGASTVVIKVGRVRAEPQYERKAFVYRTGDATYTDDFYNTFYVSPAQMTRSTLQQWLAESGMFATVADVDSLVAADWLLESRLIDFYVDRRSAESDRAVVRLAMTVVDGDHSPSRALLERVYEETELAEGSRGDDYVRAWSGALSKIYTALETDLADLLSQHRGR